MHSLIIFKNNTSSAEQSAVTPVVTHKMQEDTKEKLIQPENN